MAPDFLICKSHDLHDTDLQSQSYRKMAPHKCEENISSTLAGTDPFSKWLPSQTQAPGRESAGWTNGSTTVIYLPKD